MFLLLLFISWKPHFAEPTNRLLQTLPVLSSDNKKSQIVADNNFCLKLCRFSSGRRSGSWHPFFVILSLTLALAVSLFSSFLSSLILSSFLFLFFLLTPSALSSLRPLSYSLFTPLPSPSSPSSLPFLLSVFFLSSLFSLLPPFLLFSPEIPELSLHSLAGWQIGSAVLTGGMTAGEKENNGRRLGKRSGIRGEKSFSLQTFLPAPYLEGPALKGISITRTYPGNGRGLRFTVCCHRNW